MNKIPGIQILRAAAALTVTVAHSASEVGWTDYYLHRTTTFPGLGVGAVGVDLFFVISGFVMVYSSEPYFGSGRGAAKFFVRRLIRIVPLYWLATGAVLLWWRHVGTSFHQEDYSLANLFASLLFVAFPRPSGANSNPILGQGWTLNYEMFFYLVFAATLFFQRRKAVALASSILLVVAALRLFGDLPPFLMFYTRSIVLEFIFGMLLGLACREGYAMPRFAGWPLIIVSIAFVLFVDAMGINADGSVYRWLLWGLPAAVVVAGTMALESDSPLGAFGTCLLFLGEASYSIYLFHGMFLSLPRSEFLNAALWVSNWPWLYSASLVTFAVGCSCLIHLAFEKPVTRWLQKTIMPNGSLGSQLRIAARPMPGEADVVEPQVTEGEIKAVS